MIGTFFYNVQVRVRKSWDRSLAGRLVYGANSEQLTVNSSGGILLQQNSFINSLRASKILQWISHYEIFFAVLLAIAPIAPTMACAGLAAVVIIAFAVNKLIFHKTQFNFKKMSVLSWFVFAFLVLTFVYALTSLDIIGSIKVWFIYVVFISMFFIARQAIKSKKELNIACWILVSVGALVALYGVYQNFFGSNLGHAWLDQTMFTDITVRVYSTLGNPNVLGEYLLLTIPVGVGMIWYKIKFWKTYEITTWKKVVPLILLIGFVGIQLLCMIYTQSRGCWIAIAFTAFIFILFVDKRWILLFIVAIAAAPFLLPQSILDRLSSVGNMGDSSTAYRVSIWMGTLNMLQDFWLTGVGLGAAAFAKVYPFYSYSMITAPHAHNLFLETISEMGIVGLVILLGIIFSFVFMVLRKYVKISKKTANVILAVAFVAGFLGFILQGMFDYVWYNYRVFLMFWIFMGIGSKILEITKDESQITNGG